LFPDLGLKFTNAIVIIAGGNLWIALILAMLASLVLGMGLTTTAVYITLAALVIPALVHMGVEPIAGHLFAFLLRPGVGHHAAGGPGRVCRRGHCRVQPDADRVSIPSGWVSPNMSCLLSFVFAPGMLFVGSWHQILLGIVGGFRRDLCPDGGHRRAGCFR
jgi:hypothetical protein